MAGKLRALFVLIAFAMLWAPVVGQSLHLEGVAALDEKRRKAARPESAADLFTEGVPFARAYEKYFDDSFGFRDLLIGIKHQADYSLFGESDQVLVGRDGWLFYKSVVEREQVELERLPKGTFDRILERLLRLREVLAKRNMTLVVIPCPMNSDLYPEMLPPSAPRRPVPTAFDRYRTFLSSHPEIVTIDPVPILWRLKPEMRLFHKTDFHWTDPAAAHVARAFVDRLAALSSLPPLWDQPIVVEKRADEPGGEATAMGLLSTPLEERWYVRAQGLHPEGGLMQWGAGPNEWTYDAEPAGASRLLPETVIFGDSFEDAFDRSGGRKYFSRLRKFYNYEFANKYSSIPDGTRFVVLQHVSGVLNAMAADAFWPREVLYPGSVPAGEGDRKLTAYPDPIPNCNRAGLGVTTVSWRVPGANVEVHIDAPDGPLFAAGGETGTAETGEWVRDGTVFYLQEAPRQGRASRTLAKHAVRVKAGCGPK